MKHASVTRWIGLVCVLPLLGCDAFAGDDPVTPPPVIADGGGTDAGPGPGPLPVDGGGEGGSSTDADTGPCATEFRFVPQSGTSYTSVAVTGEWNNWDKNGVKLNGPNAQGAYSASVELAQGLVAYKLLLDGNFILDTGARLRKYVGGVENSAVRVTDCHLPTLTVKDHNVTRPSAGQGHFVATVLYAAGKGGSDVDSSSIKATLRKDDATSSAGATLAIDGKSITVDAPSLGDGKYTVFVEAKDKSGKNARTLRLVFWVESQEFRWDDALIYMAMTDRFKDGDGSNNPPSTPNVDPRADFKGGDLEGVRLAIANGTFDTLGVRALWLSPFHTNPSGAWLAADGVHLTMGYHGYWPVKAREVDARIGGNAGLKALVKEAHAHGIRVLQDFVVNHVHQDHEYFQAHPQWFRTGCTCGTSNCDWTEHRLDCMFSGYMPDVNWTNSEVVDTWSEDAVWWIDTFDLDGLRVDAVKHVEDISVINMSARIRDEFETAGTRVLLTGETAMGWNGDSLPANADQYGTISRYIGPSGLDGQADFVLYHAVPYRSFAADERGMLHVDYWTQQSQLQYPAGALMTPYIGSHDTARFVTIASQPGSAGNQWNNPAPMPVGSDGYQRLRVGLSWLLGIPGAPLLYYGDEYGEWGGADPNNRVMWRGDGSLSTEEQATLSLSRKLGSARKELVALRRGTYTSVTATEEVLLFARQAGNQVALVALNKAAGPRVISTSLQGLIPEGTVLHDRLGGANVSVSGGAVSIALGARGAAVLAP